MKGIASAIVLASLVACGGEPAALGGGDSGASSPNDAGSGDAAGDAPVLVDGSPEAAPGDASSADGAACPPANATYDARVLCDHPAAYWAMHAASATEPDLAGGGHTGTYEGGAPVAATMPNGDPAAAFDGATQYLTVPSSPAFSIPTTGSLTWEAWIRPDVLQFPHDDGQSGYVDWMGKCESYAPSCEWEARMYDLTTQETPNRPSRLSAYVFNPSASLGSAADWQPASGVIVAGQWHHVVGEYTTKSQPSDCADTSAYPGSIDIWVDGVKWDHASHGQTGCMSQYMVTPVASSSPLDIGTMAKDSWFKGAIGKVALYGYLLTPEQIAARSTAMTGKTPSGSCTATCQL
jgi:hypothetical protein